jgi:hypothetical protein
VTVKYDSASMDSKISLWLEAGFFFLMFFVLVPLIAAGIGYAAWQGKPKNSSRDRYATGFAAAGIAAGFNHGVRDKNAGGRQDLAVSGRNCALCSWRCSFRRRQRLHGRHFHLSSYGADAKPASIDGVSRLHGLV